MAPTERLLDLMGGHRATAAICAAVELGFIEALAAGPRSAPEIAAKCSAHEEASIRLLAALVGLGICQAVEDGKYGLTEIGACLAQGSDGPLRDWALFEGKMLARSWIGLSESVRTGRTAADLAGSEARYEEIRRDPRLASLFDAAMVSMTRLIARDVLAAYDFGAAGRILDIGGGAGALLVEILRANPGTTGCVLDLPRCEAAVHLAVAEANLTPRAGFLAADFFAGLPSGFDTLLLKSVLHNWDDVRCAQLLANCRLAVGDRGRIVVIERFLSAKPEVTARDASTALSDLNMLRGPGGRERTEFAYRNLLSRAGLCVVHLAWAGRYNVLVAQPQA